MPERLVRQGILSSDPVCSLGWAAEVFYRRLMSVADDYGRYDGRKSMLRAALYPLQLEKVSDSDIGKWRLETAKAGLVRVYAVEGKEYVQIEKFDQRIQGRPKYPAPVDDVPRSTGDPPKPTVINGGPPDFPALFGDGDGGEDGIGGEDVRTRAHDGAKKHKTAMPQNFTVSDRVAQWATGKQYGRLDEHLESFKSKCAANGYKYIDWDAGFMEAIRADWAGLRTDRAGRLAFDPTTWKPEEATSAGH